MTPGLLPLTELRLKNRLLGRSALSGLPLLGVSLAALAGVSVSALPARALPQDGVVVAGAASIAQTGAASLAITQSSMAAVIDWRSFDIGAHETVEVFQPSSMASLLNRVTGGGGPSEILGTLQAQGRLTLINPAGISIGAGARIDVAGLVASTADMSSQDFMAGRGDFALAGRAGARIVNAGDISVRDGGLAALVAPGVENSGTIAARLGRVQLASGETFTLDMYGDDLIRIGVSDAMLGSIVNTGRISSDGGVIEITARSGAAAVNSLINMGGVVEARSVGVENGAVVFYGADAGVVQVTGTVDVSGRDAGETGGAIRVLGEKVALTGNARLDASGDAGGGVILVGGDYQGGGATPTASRTYVGRDVTITTDAITSGDAGKAVVWADGDTRYYGSISARGGAASGNGGTVEVSGKQNLGFDGKVDTSAPNGNSGTLLLDPDDIIIVNGIGANDPEFQFDGKIFFADGGGTFTISEGAVESLTGTLVLEANNSIHINTLADGVLSLSSTTSISFKTGAGGISASDLSDVIQVTGGGNLTLDATAGTGDGIIDVGGIVLNGGTLTLIGEEIFINPGGAISTAGGDINLIAKDILIGETINAASGDVIITNTSGTAQIGNNPGVDLNISAAELALVTANSLTIDSPFTLTVDGISAADTDTINNLVFKTGESTIFFSGAASVFANNVNAFSQGSVTVFTNVTANNGFVQLQANTNGIGGGTFTVNSGNTVKSLASDVYITADDLTLDGSLNASTGTVTITNTNGDILIGNSAAGAMVIDNGELSNITAGHVEVTSAGHITVADILDFESDGFNYIQLIAPGNINFSVADSSFKSLLAFANGDINVSFNLTTTFVLAPINDDTVSLALVADHDLNGTGALTIADDVSGADNIYIEAADLILSAAISTFGSIDITNTSGTLEIGASPGASMNISNAELALLDTDTVRLASVGSFDVDGVSPAATTGRAILMDARGGNLNFTGAVSFFDAPILGLASGVINLGADLIASNFLFPSPVLVAGGRTLTSETGGTFDNIVDSADAGDSLTVEAAGGNVNFESAVGSFNPLSALTVNASNIDLNGVTTVGPQVYTAFGGAVYLNGIFNLVTGPTDGDFEVIGDTLLLGDTSITAAAVRMERVNGTSDFTINATTDLTLGSLGDTEFGAPLNNVILDANGLSIGNIEAPLYVDVASLIIDVGAGSADLTGFIDNADGEAGRALIVFNGVSNSSDTDLVFDGFNGASPPPPPPGSGNIFIINAATAADDAQILDGIISFSNLAENNFTISTGALEALNTANLTLQAPIAITIADIADNELTLGIAGQVKFETGSGGFAMQAGDRIRLTALGADLTIDGTTGTGNGNLTLGALQTTDAVTLTGNVITFNGAINTGAGNLTINNSLGDVRLGAGGATSSGYLYITNADLTRFTAGRLTINSANDFIIDGASGPAVNDVRLNASTDFSFSGAASLFTGDINLNASEGQVFLGANLSSDTFYFSDPVLINGNRVITSPHGGEFSSAVDVLGDSSGSLTVTSPSGDVTFVGPVGSINILDSLTVTASSIELHDVFTTGSQTFTETSGSTVHLDGLYTVVSGNFTVNGHSLLEGATQIVAPAGSVTMGAVDSNFFEYDLTIQSQTGLVLGPLGADGRLQNVTLNSAGNIIGSVATPLYVDVDSLAIIASGATLDSTGLISHSPISSANVSFNGAFNSANPGLTFTAAAAPEVFFTDFIADGSRSGFNDFETLPSTSNAGTSLSPFSFGGITVTQVGGGTDIWTTCTVSNNCSGAHTDARSWYPSGGDNAYTSITKTDTSNFANFGVLVGSGYSQSSSTYTYDVRLDGTQVLFHSTWGEYQQVVSTYDIQPGRRIEMH
ncbi:MAG: filamentous hemagglutinin N-terminal domain-containing protein, partial [Alphaproteobacteria bacterium]